MVAEQDEGRKDVAILSTHSTYLQKCLLHNESILLLTEMGLKSADIYG